MSYIVRGVAAVAVLAICGMVVMMLNATAPEAGQVRTVATPPPIKVFEARRVALQRQWSGYGVAAAISRADVPSRVMATVLTIPANIQAGRPVTVNQVIAQLDPSDFQRQLDQAMHRIEELDALLAQIEVEEKRYAQRLAVEREDLALAQSEAQRIEGLLKSGAARQFELDAVRRNVLAAERAVITTQELLDKIVPRKAVSQALKNAQLSVQKAAQENVDRSTIRSPIDGVLESVDVKVGESLQSGQRVARVVDLSRIEVPVQLPVAARPDVFIGGRLELCATNDTAFCWDATIVRMSPADDASTRTMTVYAEVNQASRAKAFGTSDSINILTPGQFLSATTWSEQASPRWLVPRRSIRAGRVLVVKNDIIHTQPVTIDYLHEGRMPIFGVPDDQWAVLAETEDAPLNAGDLVVLNASISLRAGDRVTPVVAQPDAAIVQPTRIAPAASTADKPTPPVPMP